MVVREVVEDSEVMLADVVGVGMVLDAVVGAANAEADLHQSSRRTY